MSDPQQEASTWTRIVAADDMIPWVDALRDPNAIHRDPAAAAALGLPSRTVNPGPLNLAYALNLLARLRPEEDVRRIEARFGANVLAEDRVVVTGGCDAADRFHATVRAGEGPSALEVVVRLGPAA